MWPSLPNIIGCYLLQIAIKLNSAECREITRNNPEVMAKRKAVVKMLLTIVAVFAICWLPINISN